jgi:ribosomal protein S18 acetylase RimI-like enzyme
MEKNTTNRLRFRPANTGDFEAVRDLSEQLARHIEAPAPALTPDGFARRYVGRRAPMRLLLAVDGGRVAGLVAWTITCELYSGDVRAYISDLVVDKPARGKGIGAALMARVITTARQRGVTRLGWEVWHRNDAAAAFYEGLGATRDREALSYVMDIPA